MGKKFFLIVKSFGLDGFFHHLIGAIINCLLLLDFLRSGSSSEPQNTGQPGEEEQEEMRDTLDPPEDA